VSLARHSYSLIAIVTAYLDIVVVVDEVSVDRGLEDELGEDLPELLSAAEHADGQDLHHFGIDACNLLVGNEASDAVLHEVEGGGGGRLAETHLDDLHEEVTERHHVADAQRRAVLAQERHSRPLQVGYRVVKELIVKHSMRYLPRRGPGPGVGTGKDIRFDWPLQAAADLNIILLIRRSSPRIWT